MSAHSRRHHAWHLASHCYSPPPAPYPYRCPRASCAAPILLLPPVHACYCHLPTPATVTCPVLLLPLDCYGGGGGCGGVCVRAYLSGSAPLSEEALRALAACIARAARVAGMNMRVRRGGKSCAFGWERGTGRRVGSVSGFHSGRGTGRWVGSVGYMVVGLPALCGPRASPGSGPAVGVSPGVELGAGVGVGAAAAAAAAGGGARGVVVLPRAVGCPGLLCRC